MSVGVPRPVDGRDQFAQRVGLFGANQQDLVGRRLPQPHADDRGLAVAGMGCMQRLEELPRRRRPRQPAQLFVIRRPTAARRGHRLYWSIVRRERRTRRARRRTAGSTKAPSRVSDSEALAPAREDRPVGA